MQIQGIGKESLIKYPKIMNLVSEECENILDEVVVVESKVDGCLEYKNRVLLEDGSSLAIGYIVQNKLKYNVASYNVFTRQIEYKPILNWYINEKSKEWIILRIRMGYRQRGDRVKNIMCTPNHQFYNGTSYVDAIDLKAGDKVCEFHESMSYEQQQLIYGSLLGDGWLSHTNDKNKGHKFFAFLHSEKQTEYVKFKRKILSNLFANENSYISGYGSKTFRVNSICSPFISNIYTICYPNDTKSITNSWLENLGIMGIAFWYMDDGHTDFSEFQNSRAHIATNGFSFEEVNILSKFLEYRGYKNSVLKDRVGYRIDINTNSSEKLFSDISPFIPNCMKYKVPSKYRNIPCIIEYIPINNTNELNKLEITEIKTIKSKKGSNRYNIEVKDNNNFFINKILVHNSNFRARYIDNEERFIHGSRNNILPPDTNTNSWKAIKSYNKSVESYKNNILSDVIYYSESMSKHTLEYPDSIPDTIGYDILDLNTLKFYPWRKAKEAFEAIGIPFIHVHFEKHGKDITIEELNELIKQSPYREQGKPDEGIVIKCYDKLNKYNRPLWAKLVTDDFKEKNRAVFGENGQPKKQRPENEVKIADTYLTDARFNKAILYFQDEGKSIGMELMPVLYRYLVKDILSEYIISIYDDYKSINFVEFGKIIAGRTAQKLKSYLLTKSINTK